MSKLYKLKLALVCILLISSSTFAEVGEFSIRRVIPLQDNVLTHLRRIVIEHPEAAKIASEVIEEVEKDDLLNAHPHPLAVLEYEGLVNTDPRRIATVARLREMDSVAQLVRYWQLTGSPAATETLQVFITGWATTYQPTGNDVNENKFYPLFVAYEGIRDTFPDDKKKIVDEWVQAMAAYHLEAIKKSNNLTNRYTKHLRLVAIFSRILNKPEWMGVVEEGIKRFVNGSLYADGTSEDLKRRDTLTYHGSALKPVIEIAMISGAEGMNLYRWEGAKGGSIEKSVNFVVPYALGEKTREEWANSRNKLDHRRASSGLEKYRQGRLFDPMDALELMELACFFDPELKHVVAQLRKTSDSRYTSWQMLVNQSFLLELSLSK